MSIRSCSTLESACIRPGVQLLSSHLDALILVSGRGGRAAPPPAAPRWYTPPGCVRLIDRRTILISTSSDCNKPPPLPGHKARTLRASSSRHETDSGRPDEDEQDLPDAIRHLFRILYSGHLLFPKYVPAR